MDCRPSKCHRKGRALAESRNFRNLGLLGWMVRPCEPAERRSLEAWYAATILQGNTVPLWLAGWLSCAQPVRERSGYVSKKLHSHVSLVRFCESLFGLPTLNQRDAEADDMSDCFDFK